MGPKGSLPCSQEPATGPILSEMNLLHTFPPYFPKVHSNIIFSCTCRRSTWSLPFRFNDQNFVHISRLSQVRGLIYVRHDFTSANCHSSQSTLSSTLTHVSFWYFVKYASNRKKKNSSLKLDLKKVAGFRKRPKIS
jgi:hypothetical protein